MSLLDGLAWERATVDLANLRYRAYARLEAKLKAEEKEYGRPFAVGDRVSTWDELRGTIVAIHAGDAWVSMDTGGHRSVVLRNLKRVPKPRVGWTDWLTCQSDGNRAWAGLSRFEAVELTDEVRERVKDLL